MSPPAIILLVEDHDDTATIFSVVLRKMGHDVQVARTAAEAREAAALQTFDLMICDITLPDGDGCDLLREFKASSTIRAIATTGRGFPEDFQRSKEAGFAHHLLKPISLDVLRSAVEDALGPPISSLAFLVPSPAGTPGGEG